MILNPKSIELHTYKCIPVFSYSKCKKDLNDGQAHKTWFFKALTFRFPSKYPTYELLKKYAEWNPDLWDNSCQIAWYEVEK